MKAQLRVLASLSIVAIAAGLCLLPNGTLFPITTESSGQTYRKIVFPEDLHNGDFYTNAGTRLHFNEEGVTEGGYLEIAPLGGLYLTTPINGLQSVTLDLYTSHYPNDYYEDKFNFSWCSAPYEAMDIYDGGKLDPRNRHDFSPEDSTDLPPRYFSITNPSDSKSIRINAIAIDYRCASNYESIVGGPLQEASSAYDDTDSVKTLRWNVNSDAAHVDFFDRGFLERDLLRYPGTYPVAYTVYSASGDHAFQYSKLSSYTVEGYENGKHAVTFHNAFDHAGGNVYEAADKQDYSGPYPAHWIWDAPINDFTNITEDRDYYPVMNAFGFDPNGRCSTVSANWYLNEGFVEMPAPDHVDEGYQFVGWYTDSDFRTPYDVHRTHNSHLTLFAKVIKSAHPVRPVYYYDVDRRLMMLDYATLNQVSGDTRYGTYLVKALYDHGFYYNASETDGYCKSSDYITVQERSGPVVILTIDDQTLLDPHQHEYHVEYRSETVTGDTFYTATHFSDRQGYRELFDLIADVDRPLPALQFHISEDEGETFKTITSTDGYIYPYARRNTYLDDLDALTEIGPYAYACYSASSAKPLYGLAGHNRVSRVGRRAFFNRFGLADNASYFPPNAKIFDTEAYANVFFNNNILILPNTLQKIGPRCFMGCRNLKRVYLPLSLASVGANAFGMGTFDEGLDQFNDVHNEKRLDFYYQGSEAQYHALPLATRQNIEANARSITYGVDLHLHPATDYFDYFDCPYTQKYRPEELPRS